MSGQGGLTSGEASALPAGQAAKSEPNATELQVIHSAEARGESSEEEEEEEEEEEGEEEEEEGEEEEEEEEEEAVASARLEPSTLPWSGDKHRAPDIGQDSSEKSEKASPPEDEDMYGGGPDLAEPQRESSTNRARWRESMPEGDRWRDDETELQRDDKGNGFLADDEAEGGEESTWNPEKTPLSFTPHVRIVHPSSKEPPEGSEVFLKKDEEEEQQRKPDSAAQFYPDWAEEESRRNLCQQLCGEKVKASLAMVASAIIFPLLVWGGYALLPFDPPVVLSSPLRVMYTLRCSFFATIPILLGMVVLGGARLRYGTVAPLYDSKLVHREVAVHWHYVNESLSLFLFFFLQLAVMATYVSHDLVKLVPLLTILFVFGRLIYWLCLALGRSSVRALGFGFSFLPILVMLGANLYYVCSAVAQEAVFQVAPPTTAPPPRQRFWG